MPDARRIVAGLLGTAAALLLATGAVAAETAGSATNADAILEQSLANRALKDFTLKARLFVDRDEPISLEILVRNTAAETRTIYRAANLDLLVVQPVHGPARVYLRGRGELTGPALQERLLGSSFRYYDLGLPFLQWPHPKLIGEDRTRGRNCYLLESVSPTGPYRRAKMWIDEEFHALLRAELFNENGDLAKRFAVTSFKRIDDVSDPRALEIADVPPGQALPSQEKSRLEIYEGDYRQQLPAAEFSPDQFGAK